MREGYQGDAGHKEDRAVGFAEGGGQLQGHKVGIARN